MDWETQLIRVYRDICEQDQSHLWLRGRAVKFSCLLHSIRHVIASAAKQSTSPLPLSYEERGLRGEVASSRSLS